jgi:hypothetical protein
MEEAINLLEIFSAIRKFRVMILAATENTAIIVLRLTKTSYKEIILESIHNYLQ